MSNRLVIGAIIASGLALAGCASNPLKVSRSVCPAVAIPAYAGSMTAFQPAESRNADAIDFTAQLARVNSSCTESETYLTTDLSFQVTAQRRHTNEAREVYLPLFVAMAQGGNVLVSKQQTGVLLKFAAGESRAEASGGARSRVARSAVTLPADVQDRLSRKRRPDEEESLIDPMSDPSVKAAVRSATFEILVGFQLDDPSLAYNIGK